VTPKRSDVVAEPARHPEIGEINLLKMFGIDPRARFPATLVRHDGAEDSIIITQWTAGGFRLAVLARPGLGEDVHIRVPGQSDIPGKIRWTHGEEAGGSF
jgi:hypothetical protein